MVKRLTKQSIAKLKPLSKAYIEYDVDLSGFGVAVYPSGVGDVKELVLEREVDVANERRRAERDSGRMRQQAIIRESDVERGCDDLAPQHAGSGRDGVEQCDGERTGVPAARRYSPSD
jgi:hypothetical protein